MPKRWVLRPRSPRDFVETFPEIDPALLQLLYSRGLRTQVEIDEFIDPDYSRDVHDPFGFLDMEKATARVIHSIKQNEPIVVYGDYDADGVCATAILSETVRSLGGNVDVYIPFRETEGYGLNVRAVEELAKKGTRVIVTVDCGTTNVEEIAMASKKGIDVIVTDHHDEPPRLPDAFAIINPELSRERYPFRHLSGAGVAFKLATALLMRSDYGVKLGRAALPSGSEKWMLDLVAISTVTDMVPLLGENRVLVRYGLSVLQKTRRRGLRALFATMRSDMQSADEETIGFQIGPRLNAAGRMDHASTAYRLLVTGDDGEAVELAEELSQRNVERQRLTEATVQQALAQLGNDPEGHLLYVIGDDWLPGVMGLVAGKLCERFNRPAIVFAKSQGRYVGSGRSIDAFDITAALNRIGPLLDRYGGHPQACGLALKKGHSPKKVGEALRAIADEQLRNADLTPPLSVDAEVVLDDINWKLVEDVSKLAPFGEEAERPKFLSRGLRVVKVDTVGKDGKHLRLHVSHATSEVKKTIGFRFGSWIDSIDQGDSVDCVFEVGVNEWNGNREIELKIVDLDHSVVR